MRLIDGEKLFALLNQRYENSDGEARMAYSRALEHLCYMPTIDPVKHGRWEFMGENSTGKLYRCTNCKSYINPNRNDVENRRAQNHPPYCPNCGAKMDADE